MDTKSSAAALPKKNGSTKSENKDSRYAVRRQIMQLLSGGGSFTVVQINRHTGGSDARKRISELRYGGVPIVDAWTDETPRRKIYWLAPDNQG